MRQSRTGQFGQGVLQGKVVLVQLLHDQAQRAQNFGRARLTDVL